MRASKFISEIAKRHNVSITLVDGRLRVRGIKNLPAGLRTSIAGHQENLLRYLVDSEDLELDRGSKSEEELARLGFVRVLVSETFRGNERIEQYRYAHLDGDEVGDAILLNLLDPAEAAADVQSRDERSKEMAHAFRNPAEGDILKRYR